MDVSQLQRTYSDLHSSLFRDGILNQQFRVLQQLQLQDENNQGFVYEMVSFFFDNTQKLINELSSNLNQQDVDYKKIDDRLHCLKGSSATIGAQRIINVCVVFLDYCQANNLQDCFNCMQQLNQEYLNFKSKLETLFTVDKQIVVAGGSVPVMQ